MRKIYICSKYGSRGEISANLEFAKVYTMQVIEEGNIPICPHLFYSQVLNDQVESQRIQGLRLGLELLKDCAELRICSVISEGMKDEIRMAIDLGIPVRINRFEGVYTEDAAFQLEKQIQQELVEVIQECPRA